MSLSLPGTVCGFFLVLGTIIVGIFIATEQDLIKPLTTGSTPESDPNFDERVVRNVAWSADGRKLLSQSRSSDDPHLSVAVHEFTDGTRRGQDWEEPLGIPTNDASLSPDGHHVLVATENGELLWIDLLTFETVEFANSPKEPFRSTSISRDGNWVGAATERGCLYVGEVAQGYCSLLESEEVTNVYQVRLSHDGSLLLCGRENGLIEIWQTRPGKLLQSLQGRFGPNSGIFLANGTKFLASQGVHSLQITDVFDGVVKRLEDHRLRTHFGACHLDASWDGSIVAWSGIDHRVVICDIGHSGKRLELMNPSVILNISLSPDGRFLAVAGCEPIIRIYDTTTGLELRRINTSPAQRI